MFWLVEYHYIITSIKKEVYTCTACKILPIDQGFIQDFWLGGRGGGKSIGASTQSGNARGYLSSLTICTDFSIIIKFSQILGGGGGESQFPNPCMKPYPCIDKCI